MTRNSYLSSKDWMDLARYSKEYIDGVEYFLDFAYSCGDPQGEENQCPCAKCCNIHWTQRNEVYDHLICYGFVKGYTRWIYRGEWDIKLNVDNDMDYSRDGIDVLLNDQFRDVANEISSLKEEMNEMREEMRHLFSQLLQNNPRLNVQDIPGFVGSNLVSPVDASSTQVVRGQNLPYSSGSTHDSVLQKGNGGDQI